NLIGETTNYPIDLIVSHMSQISLPDAKYLLSQKYLNCQRLAKQTCQKVAVHLHVFYVDLLDEFLTAFEDWNFHYDLFITTDSDIKRKEIKEILQRKGKTADIRVTGNRGRDIYPMLLLKDKLSQYDYIGHFH
ncbi:TPA: alpha-L-Rha alpha-1,3-L-rhamnosyltransferase, partial [Streptococcus pyogenes]|nr:alpha-L-Rha alpha-1,3-L-rhamnosyltransferase [Streptococcus pyogenes]